MPSKLTPAETLGRTFRSGFHETHRWLVKSEAGESLGEIWRAEDHLRGVVCWMLKPTEPNLDLVDRHVISGYGRTTKKGVVAQLEEWAALRGLNKEIAGTKLHCSSHREFRDYASCTYLAIADDGALLWLNLTHNLVERPYMGAMGAVGWHGSTMVRDQSLCSYDCATENEAIELLVVAAIEERREQLSAPRRAFSPLSVPTKRFYGALGDVPECQDGASPKAR